MSSGDALVSTDYSHQSSHSRSLIVIRERQLAFRVVESSEQKRQTSNKQLVMSLVVDQGERPPSEFLDERVSLCCSRLALFFALWRGGRNREKEEEKEEEEEEEEDENRVRGMGELDCWWKNGQLSRGYVTKQDNIRLTSPALVLSLSTHQKRSIRARMDQSCCPGQASVLVRGCVTSSSTTTTTTTAKQQTHKHGYHSRTHTPAKTNMQLPSSVLMELLPHYFHFVDNASN
ncbi:hypothetical protein LSTR_LSTR010757 [Laodelphax striatellus]|uniref:Uncharacterized protein n=1 Tax=Laodelphax striatellus TaxID=195883 RepID=A0A482XT47_LAOST|nr:hypothetical protein LSTR_LSTR010757 [Laodelphax striatellus]